jgi:peptidoglycan/xylan/chitin deacetylase (PgdA/CDA1 family)
VPIARGLFYLATVAALALLARALVIGPLPLWLSITALVAYVAWVTLGHLVLGLGMFVDVTTRGSKRARGVALTFDDGPHPEHTPKILDLLDGARVKATFFVIGRKAAEHPEIVRDIVARGHAIGVHGYAHDRLFSLRSLRFVRDDLGRAVDAVAAITGERPWLFRPPVGHTSLRIARAVRELDLEVVGWSVRGIDGLARSRADRVAARVVPGLRDGAIVLLHDAAERDTHVPAALEALPRILAAMDRKDLAGVRVDRWLMEPVPRRRRRDKTKTAARVTARRSSVDPRADGARGGGER